MSAKNFDPVLGALIGLSGAINNNGKKETTDEVVIKAILNDDESEIENIKKEKLKIAPNCATCQSPCGNTSDYTKEKWLDATEEEIEIKGQLWDEVKNFVRDLNAEKKTGLPEIIYKAISFLGYGLEAKAYQKLIGDLKRI